MPPLGMQTMAQILDFDDQAYGDQSHAHNVPLARQRADRIPRDSRISDPHRDELSTHEFWPEVSCRLATEDLPDVDPANKPGRVLTEVFLLLAAAGEAILAVSLFVTPPT